MSCCHSPLVYEVDEDGRFSTKYVISTAHPLTDITSLLTRSRYSHIFYVARNSFFPLFFFLFDSLAFARVLRYVRRARGERIKCIQSRISSAAYNYDKIGDGMKYRDEVRAYVSHEKEYESRYVESK
ncbi:hypothetical protein PUN28_006373 [Cardiocondyla obscurior]|uniref:Uncharacterized protein n=1 Tax=Cardiocondyla obscurior TaxID=286306 RepID=A0AAW2GAF5_9HYME